MIIIADNFFLTIIRQTHSRPVVFSQKNCTIYICFATVTLSSSTDKTYWTRASFTFGNVL